MSVVPGSVALGFCQPGVVSARFHESVLYTMLGGDPERRIVAHISIRSGPRIARARNDIVEAFLASSAEWLWMVDTDMVWAPDALYRLLGSAEWAQEHHATTRVIVGGLCFAGAGYDSIRPTLYRVVDPATNDGEAVQVDYDFPRPALDEVGNPEPCRVRYDATGAAFVLIHRSLLEALEERYGWIDTPAGRKRAACPWFAETVLGGVKEFGEDWTFCVRVGSVGGIVVVDTAIAVGHEKDAVYGLAEYDAIRAGARAVPVVPVAALPALPERNPGPVLALSAAIPSEPTYVVIPVKDRHEMTAGLLEALLGDEYLPERIYVLDNGSRVPARAALRVLVHAHPGRIHVLDRPKRNLSALWNLGLELAAKAAGGAEHQVAILNNDLAPESGFLCRLAQGIRADPRVAIAYPDWGGQWGSAPGSMADGELALTEGIAAAGGMSGWAFMVAGEASLRFDEAFAWWYGDTDLEARTRASLRWILRVGGATAIHLEPNLSSQSPEKRWLIAADEAAFRAKWAA